MDVILDNLDVFAAGLRTTLALTLWSFVVAMVIGVVVASFRVSPIPPLRVAGATYVEIFRNTPLAVLFVLFFFGLTKVGIKYGAFTTAVIVLGLYTGAYVAETVRSGIATVSRGQAEAARSIGLGFTQVMTIVVLPQALRSTVGPLGGLFIALVKNSSIAAIIAVEELLFRTDGLANSTARPIPVYLGAAVAYLLLTVPAGAIFRAIERRVAIQR